MSKLYDFLSTLTVRQRLEHFLDWLAKQPRETPYEFSSNTDCAQCKFVKGHGEAIGFEPGEWTCGEFLSLHRTPFASTKMILVPTDSTPETILQHPNYLLQNSKTLGELHDRLKHALSLDRELTEAELDALELRPLVGLTPAA